MKGKKVLLIDDDAGFLYLASLLFKKAGAQTITARGGLDGISQLFKHQPDLTVLDVMMPDFSGFEICKRIRQISNTPIIMLTALNTEEEMLRGLEAGADDFLAKPFNPDILLARAKTVLRRAQIKQPKEDIPNFDDGRLTIEVEKRQVLVNGRRVRLTPTEFRLLIYLARNPGKVLTFEQILLNVWGDQYRGNVQYVHVYVSQLRNKLESSPRQPRYIQTVHGVGYMFQK
jgi:two-component system KDP operon response regulator KdpE